MAIFYPSKKIISNSNPPPTSGEQKMLDFLDNTLDDSFEVYFQPHLNGLLPDIVILHQNHGVLIIEVKDYNLSCYRILNENTWKVTDSKNNSGHLRSPIAQVKLYKEACCNLYIRNLTEKIILQKKTYAVINCAVYFSESSTKELNDFFDHNESQPDTYIELLGRDSLSKNNFLNILKRKYLISDRKSKYFTDDLYSEFKRVLQPSMHTLEKAGNKNIIYTDKQSNLIKSFAPRQTKIRGIAGSGKTRVLARLAVNAYLRTKSPVLIITFNITLRNYIHDMINDVRENFPWDAFVITHYHAFKRYDHMPYKTILVDEVQDYKKDWIDDIRNCLTEKGEIVFFGDEKQNIYERELVNDASHKRPYTKVNGRWNELKTTFRLKNEIASLANEFQKTFFFNNYEYEALKLQQQDLFSTPPVIEYYYFSFLNTKKIYDIYHILVQKKFINDDDICFIGTRVAPVRLIEKEFLQKQFRTCTTFETEDLFRELEKENLATKENLDQIRRSKKFNYWQESGTIKFSTIHSFKGWEIQTIFLIIDSVTPDDSSETSPDLPIISELVYTGITRAQKNLIIINIGEQTYDNFFKNYFTTN